MPRKRGGEVKGQLHLDWTDGAGEAAHAASPLPASSTPPAAVSPLVLSLPWDFKTSFPQPTPQAIDAGVITVEDADPENVRSIHDEHAREGLAVLHDLDVVLDARRRGVDPKTGRAPTTHASRERLRQAMEREPARLERWFRILMETYEEAFGADASTAFEKAIRAWHAGIEVAADEVKPMEAHTASAATGPPQRKHRRRHSSAASGEVLARLPVPRPLPEAVAEGRFGFEEDGRPVRPGPAEVRDITTKHADMLIELLSSLPAGNAPGGPQVELLQSQIDDALEKYAEDFGTHAAKQLDAYVRRQVRLRDQPFTSAPRR